MPRAVQNGFVALERSSRTRTPKFDSIAPSRGRRIPLDFVREDNAPIGGPFVYLTGSNLIRTLVGGLGARRSNHAVEE
jgi:hypothetical protein